MPARPLRIICTSQVFHDCFGGFCAAHMRCGTCPLLLLQPGSKCLHCRQASRRCTHLSFVLVYMVKLVGMRLLTPLSLAELAASLALMYAAGSWYHTAWH